MAKKKTLTDIESLSDYLDEVIQFKFEAGNYKVRLKDLASFLKETVVVKLDISISKDIDDSLIGHLLIEAKEWEDFDVPETPTMVGFTRIFGANFVLGLILLTTKNPKVSVFGFDFNDKSNERTLELNKGKSLTESLYGDDLHGEGEDFPFDPVPNKPVATIDQDPKKFYDNNGLQVPF